MRATDGNSKSAHKFFRDGRKRRNSEYSGTVYRIDVLADVDIDFVTGVQEEDASRVEFLCGQMKSRRLRADFAFDVFGVAVVKRVHRI